MNSKPGYVVLFVVFNMLLIGNFAAVHGVGQRGRWLLGVFLLLSATMWIVAVLARRIVPAPKKGDDHHD